MVPRHIPVGQRDGGEEREELEGARHQLCLSGTTIVSEVSCGPAAPIPTHGIIKSLHPLLKTARKGIHGKIHPVKELTLSFQAHWKLFVYQPVGSDSQSFQTLLGEFCSFCKPKMS